MRYSSATNPDAFTTGPQRSMSALTTAANSSGGVMGKMIDAQSIVVASTATNWYGHEGTILRYVFWHSIVLACLVGLFVTLMFLFVRLLPMISIFEVRTLLPDARVKDSEGH